MQVTSEHCPDAEIADEARSAVWQDEILRAMDYGDIRIAVRDGSVVLRGHVATSGNRTRAEQAVFSVRGVCAVQDELIVDEDLVNLVAQSLGRDERTCKERIFVAARSGIIVLSGKVDTKLARSAAEECAATVPWVRGVSNYIEVPGIHPDDEEQRVLQPRLGQETFAVDMSLGRVERVIVNPRNRRVAAVVVHGQFPDQHHADPSMHSWEMPTLERRVVIPIAEVDYVNKTEVQLKVTGIIAAKCSDFSGQTFCEPDSGWLPPYPYRNQECLWTR